MIPLEKAVVARLESHGEKFELLVDPDQAVRFRQGEQMDLEDMVAPSLSLKILPGEQGIGRIPEEGIPYHRVPGRRNKNHRERRDPSHRRSAQADDRREARQVITFIARNAVNPQTGLPHPPHRIEMAMEEARVNIDLYKNVDEQVKETMKALRPLIPIRFEEVRIAVRIPPTLPQKHTGRSSLLHRLRRRNGRKTDHGSVSSGSLPVSRGIFTTS